jgi:hypothetical protein
MAPELLTDLRDEAVAQGNARMALEVCILTARADAPAPVGDAVVVRSLASVAIELAALLSPILTDLAHTDHRENAAEDVRQAHALATLMQRTLGAALDDLGHAP